MRNSNGLSSQSSISGRTNLSDLSCRGRRLRWYSKVATVAAGSVTKAANSLPSDRNITTLIGLCMHAQARCDQDGIKRETMELEIPNHISFCGEKIDVDYLTQNLLIYSQQKIEYNYLLKYNRSILSWHIYI